ncbi:hypothetical protein Ae201684P_011756 [Aphanomyces euteiches]|nr:hypothetical protein Ae201684P_011756 [Aphanomyces euteiches]
MTVPIHHFVFDFHGLQTTLEWTDNTVSYRFKPAMPRFVGAPLKIHAIRHDLAERSCANEQISQRRSSTRWTRVSTKLCQCVWQLRQANDNAFERITAKVTPRMSCVCISQCLFGKEALDDIMSPS